jgi:hypothetical protein
MITITVTTKGFDKLEAAVRNITDLPEDPRFNPVALALKDYQDLLKNTPRPSVSEDGEFLGERWPAHKGRYRKDGTYVPPWGGIKKARGKGAVKGRVRQGATQLGNRAGGLWRSLISARPQFLNRGKSAFISTEIVYAQRQFKRRPWYGNEGRAFLRNALRQRLNEYFRRVMP